MTNYRVRQVLALGDMPDRQLRLLVALATWLPDSTRTVRVGVDALTAATGKTRNTFRRARRELESDGRVGSQPGQHRGDLTIWTVYCLPEKGVNESDPLPAKKGVNPEPGRGSIGDEKGGQPQAADLREPDRWLKSLAKPSSSLSRRRANTRRRPRRDRERDPRSCQAHRSRHPRPQLGAVPRRGHRQRRRPGTHRRGPQPPRCVHLVQPGGSSGRGRSKRQRQTGLVRKMPRADTADRDRRRQDRPVP